MTLFDHTSCISRNDLDHKAEEFNVHGRGATDPATSPRIGVMTECGLNLFCCLIGDGDLLVNISTLQYAESVIFFGLDPNLEPEAALPAGLLSTTLVGPLVSRR